MTNRDFLSETLIGRIDRAIMDGYGANVNKMNDDVFNLLRECKMEILRLKEVERQTKPGLLREIDGEVPSPGGMMGWGKGKDE